MLPAACHNKSGDWAHLSTQRNPLSLPLAVRRGDHGAGRMAKGGGGSGLIWATAEDLARNRPVVLSLYRQILRALNSPELPLGHAARLAKKAECRAIFIFGAEEKSVHNIRDLVEAARHTLGLLNRGRVP
ncbi:hypothetical protein BDA96_02G384100 [Sorghum bicolor]|uniref:LYR motif containing domain-containing protein n=2 Tax=Sorghum bicolor TaxID=4558 RepID=A0A921RSH1_SORBI|nr:hypothetical protein BDA96_02G384100 [Sorghum bicolor]